MRFFFKSKKFKYLSAISLALVVIIVFCGVFTNFSAPQSNIFSSIMSPVQKFFSGISSSVDGYFENMQSNEKLLDKIDKLEEKIAQKDKDLIKYEEVLRQNEFYEQFLEIKGSNPSFVFSPAMVIARDTSDPYGTFTIDKGTLDGVSVYDPVITSAGLIGYISDAYSTQSVVMNILNPSINVSAIDNRTRDSGNVTGDMSLCNNSLCKMMYISKSNTMAAGDYIVTSGAGGIFPADLFIGTVEEIKASSSNISYYAVIKPIADVSNINDVMVITDFDGKSSLSD